MALPNIDISPLLEYAWGLLQWVMDWLWVLCLLVFLAILVAGAGDILAENIRGAGKKRDREPPTRSKE
jgi:hypothetical protein